MIINNFFVTLTIVQAVKVWINEEERKERKERKETNRSMRLLWITLHSVASIGSKARHIGHVGQTRFHNLEKVRVLLGLSRRRHSPLSAVNSERTESYQNRWQRSLIQLCGPCACFSTQHVRLLLQMHAIRAFSRVAPGEIDSRFSTVVPQNGFLAYRKSAWRGHILEINLCDSNLFWSFIIIIYLSIYLVNVLLKT